MSKGIKQFRPRSQKAVKAIELWEAWIATPVQEIPGHGYFISKKGMDDFDDFLTKLVCELACIPDGVDF